MTQGQEARVGALKQEGVGPWHEIAGGRATSEEIAAAKRLSTRRYNMGELEADAKLVANALLRMRA